MLLHMEHMVRHAIKMRLAMAAAAAVLGITAISAHSDALVVTTNGLSFWASSTRTDADSLLYRVPGTVNEKLLPCAAVAFVLPSVEKGKAYSAEDAEKALKEIETVGRRYPKLLRHLNTLKQDWNGVLHPDTGAEAKIVELTAKFDAGDKSPAAFKDISLQLDMIRFRDKQGQYAAKMDAASERMLSEFLRIQQPRVAAMLARTPHSISNYVTAARHADAMKLCPIPMPVKKSLDDSVAKCRDATLSAICGGAIETMTSSRTVDSYLAANDLLASLTSDLGADPAGRNAVALWRRRVVDAAAKALPDCDFTFRGYPLSSDDTNRMHAGGTLACCATTSVTGVESDEQCCLIVTRRQEPSTAAGLDLSLRLVFNRSQPADRTYGLAGRLQSGATRSAPVVWKLPKTAVRDGHADIPFKSAFPRWSPAATAPPSYDFVIYIVYAAPDATPAYPKWVAASPAYTMRLTP